MQRARRDRRKLVHMTHRDSPVRLAEALGAHAGYGDGLGVVRDQLVQIRFVKQV